MGDSERIGGGSWEAVKGLEAGGKTSHEEWEQLSKLCGELNNDKKWEKKIIAF